MIQILIIAALSVLVFCIVGLLLIAVLVRPNKEAQRALDMAAQGHADSTLTRKEQYQRGVISIAHTIRGRLGLHASGKSMDRLVTAGYRNKTAIDFYFAAQLILSLGLALAGSMMHGNTLFWIVVGAALGWLAPDLWLSETIRRSKKKIRRAIPDTVDLLVICVDAGLGLDQAVLRVSDEIKMTYPDLQRELVRLHLEQKAGLPRVETWQNLANRTQIPELASLASMLMQADRFGTPITKALSTYADDIRERYRQRVEEAAAETKIKIIFPLVFCIFPCLFIVLLGPAFLNIMQGLKSIVQ